MSEWQLPTVDATDVFLALVGLSALVMVLSTVKTIPKVVYHLLLLSFTMYGMFTVGVEVSE